MPLILDAQSQLPPGALQQIQMAQPPPDVSIPSGATAEFDPPVVRAGETAFYRLAVAAPETSVAWPEKMAAPPELQFGASARGQIMQLQGARYRAGSALTYAVAAAQPGRFTVPAFALSVDGVPVAVPAATLEVVPADTAPRPPGRRLELETSATNVFPGQPVRARVKLFSSNGGIEGLGGVQINGDFLMTDRSSVRQTIQSATKNGVARPMFSYETIITPMAPGPLKIFAQGFSSGSDLAAPITISGPVALPGGPPRYVLLMSDPLELMVNPLPADRELPGFTGAMGKFTRDKLQLSAPQARVGEPLRLTMNFRAASDPARFVPPEAPRSRQWQIVADPPPQAGFTLIPLTDEAQATPAIPFCAFNPLTGQFEDLTIPPLPVTVTGESLPVELLAPDDDKSSAPLRLSDLAPVPGRTASSLRPPQLRAGLVALQFAPVAALLAAWQWARRRQFLAAHPEIIRRRRARRAVRREKIQLQKAVAAGDAAGFVRHATAAMKAACAPHFPAHPQALVGGDVLSQFAATPEETLAVRAVFAAADLQYAGAANLPADLLAQRGAVAAALAKLEARL